MATPRRKIFDPSLPVTCHCISRCVRRSKLLEQEERRRTLLARMRELCRVFAIDVLEWALLTNHFHLVAATHPDLAALWSPEEIARRWRTLSPDYAWRARNKVDRRLPAQPAEIAAALNDQALIERWRRNLGDLSVFHKFLKQRIARVINLQDDVTGHCWEGRFKSIVALDEEAVIAHMVYVALNPVRAHMAESLDGYEFASVGERVEELKRRIRAGEFAGEASAARKKLDAARLVPSIPCDPGAEVKKRKTLKGGLANPWFGGRVPSVIEGATLAAFLAEVDMAGRLPRGEKRGLIAPSTLSPLAGLERELCKATSAKRGKSPIEAARGAIETVEAAGCAAGLAGMRGNFSGGAKALARVARDTGRRFALAVASLVSGGPRRIAAEVPPPATGGAATTRS